MASWFNDCLLWLPMTAECHDPTNGQTLNRGIASHALNGVFGAGAAEPTKLTDRHGYSFDGGDQIDASTGYAPTTGEISILMAFSGPETGATDYIFDWETPLGDVVCVLTSTATELRFFVGSLALAVNAARVTLADYSLVESRFTTVVGIYDGTDTLIYVNGEYAAVAVTPVAPAATSNPMTIGSRANGAFRYTGNIYHTGMADFAISPLMVGDYHLHMLQEYNQL